ncbi:MAG: CPBP family intramembrane metalloprotease, partial [Erysipelotrichaceae bacterium]|nr:CPBP family intramembrane metalloprotease [Erysipelotrichaceae bacterium]
IQMKKILKHTGNRFLDHPILSSIVIYGIYFAALAGMVLICRPSLSVTKLFFIYVIPAAALAGLVKLNLGEKFIVGLRLKNLGKCLILGWPLLAVAVLNASLDLNWMSRITLAASPVLFIEALEFGLSEELLFRGIFTNNMMRVWGCQKHGIYRTMIITALLCAAADSINTAVHGLDAGVWVHIGYAAALGLMFSAVYLRTGNLWGCIILHTLTVLASYMNAGSAVLPSSANAAWMAITCLTAAAFAAAAFFLVRPSRQDEIKANWNLTQK